MESTEVIIARLVLGYLKGEKCRSAYKEFLTTSNHLQDTTLFKSKYLPTRFVGLTLEDILSEYFEIYKIVQGRLEATNYYNECHSKNSLVHQLLYLLNKVQSSRASTPCPRSPPYSNLGEETSPSHTGQISDVETTPAHTLPGNLPCTTENSYLHKTSRKKLHSKRNKSNSVGTIPSTDREDMSEVLAQTLLENREFHEKIAQTINKVAEKQYRVSSELDKTIKTVVKETEEDPIFDKILEEIIESTNIVDTSKGIETSSTSSSVAKNNNESFDNGSNKAQGRSESEQENHHRILYSDSKKVEEQNNEAIRSIVANSKLSSNTHEEQANNEVIVFDGSLDKYLIANTCNANTQTQPVQNPLYINSTGGLLMLPSTITTSVTGNLQIDTSPQYYFVNKQPPISWNVPAIKTSNILTEQDILAMPTIIVNDEKQNKVTTSESLLQTPVLTTVKHKTLFPKPTIEIPAEYPVCSRQGQQQGGLRKVMYPRHVKKQKRAETAVNTSTTDSVISSMAAINPSKNTQSFHNDVHNNGETTCQIKNENKQDLPLLIKDENQPKTPSPPEPMQKVTPKSGSHVRSLDFSTPPKITSTHKKVVKTEPRRKTPLFVHKKQAVKTLFKAGSKNKNNKCKNSKKRMETKSDIKNKDKALMRAWDADLRAIIPPVDDVKSETPKRKQNSPFKKMERNIKVKKEVDQQLDTTEDEAALLEAALQTPIKSEVEHLEASDTIKEEKDDKETIFTVENEHINTYTSCKTYSEKAGEYNQESTEITEDTPNKMILSPSKLKANKRSLLNGVESVNEDLTDVNLKTTGKKKNLTPEMVTGNIHYPIKANRNIMPMLVTPLKNECLPKTPGNQTSMDQSRDPNISISSCSFTPFTKILEENLKGVDINSIPTPSIPITPNFPPFTPSVDLASPYSNRPTDYSTSSSYYQPSDTEHNKSLEANVVELEKKTVKILSDVVVKEDIAVPSSSEIYKDEDKINQNKLSHPTIVNERLNVFNKTIIGKKNLNLMKRSMSLSSSSTDDRTSESSSGESENASMWEEKESNDTVICRRKPVETPKRTYILRNRTTSLTNTKEELNKKATEPKESKINKKATAKQVKERRSSKVVLKQVSKQEDEILKEEIEKTEIVIKKEIVSTKSTEISLLERKLLKELEEKRLRTVNKFKAVKKIDTKKSLVKVPSVKHQNGKFMKIKPIPNLTKSKKKFRKKTTQRKTGNKNSKAHRTSKDNLKDQGNVLSLTYGIDEKFGTLCKNKENIDKTDKSASDVEAENLIEGLKERGIHLMHNKASPNKKITEATNESTEENKDIKTIQETNLRKHPSSLKSNSPRTSAEYSSLETKQNELSTAEFMSELRETYDTQLFPEENERVVFDESKKITKTFGDYNTEVLTKSFIGKIFVEEINKEIDIPLTLSPLFTLLDIPSTLKSEGQKEKSANQKNEISDKIIQLEKIHNRRASIEKGDAHIEESCLIKDVSNSVASDDTIKSDDDLMNFAIVGSIREETPEGSNSPRSTRKRKLRSEENSHTEKKCKTLLKKINVDSFLNNIHGGTKF